MLGAGTLRQKGAPLHGQWVTSSPCTSKAAKPRKEFRKYRSRNPSEPFGRFAGAGREAFTEARIHPMSERPYSRRLYSRRVKLRLLSVQIRVLSGAIRYMCCTSKWERRPRRTSLTRLWRPSNDGTTYIPLRGDGASMSLWEISFRTQYDYPFMKISANHPGLPISMWCIWNREMIQVPTRDENVLDEIAKEIRKAGKCIDQWAEAGESRIFMLKCTCATSDSPWNVWEPHEAVEAPPAIFQDGWGYFRVIAFDEVRTRDLFKDFNKRGPTELIRKRELPLSVLPSSIWVNSLFGDLTSKQSDALLKAHRYGYYSSPRDVTTESIARSLGVSRSTYEEHLRKAENRIMGNLIPYLQLFSSGEKKPDKMPLKETPIEPSGEA